MVMWATDMDGVILLSEGGILDSVGLSPGETVGQNVSQFRAHKSWAAAKNRLLAGEDHFTVLVNFGSPMSGDSPDVASPLVYWLHTFSPLLSPSGLVIGIIAVAMRLTGAELFFGKFSDCPLGSCAVLPASAGVSGPH